MVSTFLLLQGRALLSRGHSRGVQWCSAPLRQQISTWRPGLWRERAVQVSRQLRRRPNSTQSRVEAVTWEEGATAATRPSTWSGDQIGRAFLGGAALFGIGSLSYYGLGLSGETGAIDRSMYWSPEVRQRINSTYSYFAAGIGMTAVSAYMASRAQSVMRFMVTRPILSGVTFLVGALGTSILCMSIPYTTEMLPAKITTFAVFSSVMGATIAPLVLLGGPLVARAAMYTAGVVGGLSLTAACAPSEKYLYMSGPLSIGLGVVVVASIGGMFAGPGTALFSGMQAISLYGGLALFGGFLLYDTQKIIHRAERDHQYDPVNNSMGIYLDTINIFVRILTILMNSNSRKK